jgi:hypothetical protein
LSIAKSVEEERLSHEKKGRLGSTRLRRGASEVLVWLVPGVGLQKERVRTRRKKKMKKEEQTLVIV